jgi:hypothetical protein
LGKYDGGTILGKFVNNFGPPLGKE